jgi:predicted nucleic acid-binding protein
MKYVLDSCVAVKWFLAETDSAKAIQLRDEFDQQIHDLLAPDVFPVEIAHALSREERRGLIQPIDGSQHLSDLLAFLPTLHASVTLLPRAY